MNQELHQILLSCGYKYTPARQMPDGILLNTKDRRNGYYVKNYATTAGNFPIALILRDDPYIKLPAAYILKTPDKLQGRLIPHVTQESNLCYVAQMEADWDSNDLKSTYQDVDIQIQLTLNNSITAVEQDINGNAELDGELFAYWKPDSILFQLSEVSKQKKLTTCLVESRLTDEKIRKEYITYETGNSSSEEEIVKWLAQRNLKSENISDVSLATHYVSVKPSKLSGVVWPPETFSNLLSWLAEVDHNARDKVIQSILSNIKKRNIFLLDITKQDTLSVYVELDPNVVARKRHRHGLAKKTSLRYLATIFSAKSFCIDFKRLLVIKADRATLLSRNHPRQGIGSLSNKRIALIGCGTIGGYLAALLLRNGAGCGDKYLHLYDNDIFMAHNFGRHILSAHDIGQSKSIALADYLINSVHIAKNIIGVDSQFPIKNEKLAEYDIVIDATGRPPVSKRLAFIIRTLPLAQRPRLIHSFNDGNGRASKVFIDDGTCCYGCLTSDPTIYENTVDSRFKNINQELEQYISCGSTYTPYDAAVSHITAALAQEAALHIVEDVIPWNYNEHMLDGSRSKKPRHIKRQPNCKICYER
ncbi:TPA: E2/UBC family protein [Serratia marcescens]